MDKKNTMLLTVIAVATLLVAVVGATFAYFAVSVTGSTSTAVDTNVGAAPGLVVLSGDASPLYLDMPTTNMLETAQGTYYANKTNTAATTTEYNHDFVTVSVTEGSTGTIYDCGFNLVITATGLDTDLVDADGKISFNNGTKLMLADTEVTLAELAKATDNTVTIAGTFDQTGNGAETITGNVTFVNTGSRQNELADMDATITVSVAEGSLSCAYSD